MGSNDFFHPSYGEKVKILVAEDDHEDYYLFRRRALEQGLDEHSIVRVTSLKEAKSAMEETPFDVVFLDLGLEDSVGLDTLRSFAKQHEDVATIVLSGCADTEVSLLAVKNGAQDYLFKQEIAHSNLLQKISYAMERSSLIREARLVSEATSGLVTHLNEKIHDSGQAIKQMVKQLAESENLAKDEREISSRVVRSVDKLAGDLRKVSNVARIEAGIFVACLQKTNVRDLVDAVIRDQRTEHASANFTFWDLVQPDVPVDMLADASVVTEVLKALVDNAVKHTKFGSISVETKFRSTGDGRGRFRFSVTDTGVGIEESKRVQIFFRTFAQADRLKPGEQLSVDYQLFYCQNLVQAMGGEIGVHSTLGRGSTFWFELELGFENRQVPQTKSIKGGRALIVSCSAHRQSILASQMSLLGMDTGISDSYDPATSFDKSGSGDILVLDLAAKGEQGPGSEGLQKFRAHPNWSKRSVVVLTEVEIEHDFFGAAGIVYGRDILQRTLYASLAKALER